jgi:hypothetical protein
MDGMSNMWRHNGSYVGDTNWTFGDTNALELWDIPGMLRMDEMLVRLDYGHEKRLQRSYSLKPFSRGDRIRTCDPLVPNQVRYRPALLPG